MKNLTRISVTLMLAAVVGFSSCVKNEVSEEVTQLRKAQVDKLKADIADILANTSYQIVQTRNLRMQVRFDSLFNAFDLKRDEAQYLVTLQTIQNQLEIEKRLLSQNQLQTAQAVAAYERYISSGQFQQNISDLLGKYNNESNVLNQLYNDRVMLTRQIAEAELLLAATSGPDANLTWDFLKIQLENQLADKNADLAAAEDALTDLETVYGDPTTLEATKAALVAEIAGLNADKDALGVEKNEATNTYNDAVAALDEADLAIGLMEDWDALYGEGFIQDELDLIDDSTGYAEDITDATAALVPLTAQLASANAALNTAKTAYNAKLAAYNTAKTNNDNAQNTIDRLTSDLAVANNNYQAALAAVPANPTLVASTLAIRDAIDNGSTGTLPTAIAVRDAAAGTLAKLNQAAVDLGAGTEGVPGTYTTARLAYYNAQEVVDDIQDDIDDLNDDIDTANENLDENATDLAIVRAKLEEWGPKYDAAVLAYPTLVENVSVLQYKPQTIQLQINALASMITSKGGVLTILTTQLTNLETAINTQKTAIVNLEKEIVVLETQIAQNAISKEWAEGEVVRLQAKLAIQETKITEGEAIVAYWKQLLDEAIAGV